MYKTLHGLVLREVKYKESSKILTILTEEEGKITAEAKGALKKGARFAASAQMLVWSELTFFENRGRHTLTEGSVLEDFSGLREDLGKYALGCYLAELMETLSNEDSPDPELLRTGLNALYALSRRLYPDRHVKAAAELRMMCLAGFTPETERCLSCGEMPPREPRFSILGGGTHCASCPPPAPGKSLALCPASLDALRHVIRSDARRAFTFSLPEDAAERFYRICEQFTIAQLDRSFETLDYWKKYK